MPLNALIPSPIPPYFVIADHPILPRVLVADRAKLGRNRVFFHDEALNSDVVGRSPERRPGRTDLDSVASGVVREINCMRGIIEKPGSTGHGVERADSEKRPAVKEEVFRMNAHRVGRIARAVKLPLLRLPTS